MQLQDDQIQIDQMHVDRAICLGTIRFVPSPNFDERPAGCEINLLVIHNISLPPDEFGGDGVFGSVYQQARPRGSFLLPVDMRTQGFSPFPDPPGWGDNSVRTLRETRVACGGILLAGQEPLQRLLDRHRA